MVRTLLIISIVQLSLFAFNANADFVTFSWETELDVLPSMEDILPDGVSDGQLISGSFTYDTERRSVSNIFPSTLPVLAVSAIRLTSRYSWSLLNKKKFISIARE